MQKIKYEQVNIKIFRIEKSVTFQKENYAFDDNFLNDFPSKDAITGNVTNCILAKMRRLLTCSNCLILNRNPSPPHLHQESLPCSSGNLRRAGKGSIVSQNDSSCPPNPAVY